MNWSNYSDVPPCHYSFMIVLVIKHVRSQVGLNKLHCQYKNKSKSEWLAGDTPNILENKSSFANF